MKIGAIIQARMGSSRLPGKVLKPLPFHGDETSLHHVVKRLRHVKKIGEVIIATTTESDDDAIVAKAKEMHVPHFRGSERHVLERFYFAAKQFDLDYVLRITSDCPVLDPIVVQQVIDLHFSEISDFTSSGLRRSFPIGQDASLFSFDMLEEAYRNAKHDYEKEHVTTYFYKTHPEKYRIEVLKAPEMWTDPNLRLTLDTPEDYILLCCIFDELYQENELFGLDEITNLLHRKPYLREINSDVVHKNIALGLSEQVSAILPVIKEQGYEALEKLLLSIKFE